MSRVSVVVAVRDGGRFLEPAIRSVLDQTFGDLEIVAVDDGSTDGSRGILERLAGSDPRLRIVAGPGGGQSAALRRGVELSTGEFVARMDADDISVPHRIATQIEFLDLNRGIGVLGTGCTVIDADGAPIDRWELPATPSAVRWRSLLSNPFIHPTVVIRRSLLDLETYDPSVPAGQDYDLWARVLRLTDGANLALPLLSYRVHGGQVTAQRRTVQLEEHDRVARGRIADELPGIAVTSDQIAAMRGLIHGGDAPQADVADTARLYLDLLDAFADRCGPERRALIVSETRRLAVALWRSGRGRLPEIAPALLRRDPMLPFRLTTGSLRRGSHTEARV